MSTTLKICVIGDAGVGKTVFVRRLIEGRRGSKKYVPTKGAVVHSYPYSSYTLNFWDCASDSGDEPYAEANGAIIVVCGSDKEKGQQVKRWEERFARVRPVYAPTVIQESISDLPKRDFMGQAHETLDKIITMQHDYAGDPVIGYQYEPPGPRQKNAIEKIKEMGALLNKKTDEYNDRHGVMEVIELGRVMKDLKSGGISDARKIELLERALSAVGSLVVKAEKQKIEGEEEWKLWLAASATLADKKEECKKRCSIFSDTPIDD